MQSRDYNADGLLASILRGGSGDGAQQYTLHYDLDGRVRAINDMSVVLDEGGRLKQVGDVAYGDQFSSGWVSTRGDDEHIDYDSFGRMIKFTKVTNILLQHVMRNRIFSRTLTRSTTSMTSSRE